MTSQYDIMHLPPFHSHQPIFPFLSRVRISRLTDAVCELTGISVTQEDMEAKREIARQLLFGDGVGKDETKAVSLLEDCVAHGDADAMMMLAKCCALGRGMEHNAERAEALLSDAAEKGTHEACFLLQFINKWKGGKCIDLRGLWKCAC